MKRSIKILLATLVVSLSLAAPTMAEPIEPADVRVIDGDTIAIDRHKPNIRLVGFNTPEIRNAKCEDEGLKVRPDIVVVFLSGARSSFRHAGSPSMWTGGRGPGAHAQRAGLRYLWF
jgi:endonuclease YncB( thermonuclease family)